ncbi:hypothetical protein E5676_scaffold315G001040 [Cucumis melo var. makuwa]|uniref:Uncharacterized protein n=2 Tax=Cucumis melo TaxID=3656 RepID=A0A5A7TGX1_CUCMM|nr:hypothetical protein E6C27_scaffold125G00230 [Cucumis melo var. makuwa]TYK10625.1 hypothetical protein E5676_scaffold315G001040 [Cucumis melo var. makuwa]
METFLKVSKSFLKRHHQNSLPTVLDLLGHRRKVRLFSDLESLQPALRNLFPSSSRMSTTSSAITTVSRFQSLSLDVVARLDSIAWILKGAIFVCISSIFFTIGLNFLSFVALVSFVGNYYSVYQANNGSPQVFPPNLAS